MKREDLFRPLFFCLLSLFFCISGATADESQQAYMEESITAIPTPTPEVTMEEPVTPDPTPEPEASTEESIEPSATPEAVPSSEPSDRTVSRYQLRIYFVDRATGQPATDGVASVTTYTPYADELGVVDLTSIQFSSAGNDNFVDIDYSGTALTSIGITVAAWDWDGYFCEGYGFAIAGDTQVYIVLDRSISPTVSPTPGGGGFPGF